MGKWAEAIFRVKKGVLNKSDVLYFNYIGAEPPSSECITNCCENYPFCKKCCERFEIDPDDPMLE